MSCLRPVVAPTAAVLSLSVFGWSDSFSKPVFRAGSLSAERPARRSGRTPPPPTRRRHLEPSVPVRAPSGGRAACGLGQTCDIVMAAPRSPSGPAPAAPGLSCRHRSPSPRGHAVGVTQSVAASGRRFHLTHLLSSMAFHDSIAYFSLPPNNVPASGRTTVYLSPAGGPPG